MKSVADQLRRDTARRVLQLPVEQRISLALALGDADLDLYARASGRPHDEARRVLRAQHGRGRLASKSAALTP